MSFREAFRMLTTILAMIAIVLLFRAPTIIREARYEPDVSEGTSREEVQRFEQQSALDRAAAPPVVRPTGASVVDRISQPEMEAAFARVMKRLGSAKRLTRVEIDPAGVITAEGLEPVRRGGKIVDYRTIGVSSADDEHVVTQLSGSSSKRDSRNGMEFATFSAKAFEPRTPWLILRYAAGSQSLDPSQLFGLSLVRTPGGVYWSGQWHTKDGSDLVTRYADPSAKTVPARAISAPDPRDQPIP